MERIMPLNPSHFYGLRESHSHAEHLVLVFSSCTDKNAMSLHFGPVADINFSSPTSTQSAEVMPREK